MNTQNLEQEYDYIIVGQGLAGSCLALELWAKGKSFLIYNEPYGNSASRVAGGLINPITGRKMVLTWRAYEIFSFLEEFYRKAEITLAAKFFFQMPIYRPFESVEEQNDWQGKSTDSTYAPFIKQVLATSELGQVVVNPYGGLLLNKSGYLHTNSFLNAISNWLATSSRLIHEKFDINYINFFQNFIVYKGIRARKIIFCDGVESINNPYFSTIKFRPVKGEILKINIEPKLTKIYNRGVFIIPQEGGHIVGSNYNHKELNWAATEKGREEIQQKLKALLIKQYKLVDQRAGIRPSVSDRRPVLGASNKQKRLIIFNGLGTKGVSLAPFFANQLVNYLVYGQAIDKEVDVSRFYE